jgi:hypothetical protein
MNLYCKRNVLLKKLQHKKTHLPVDKGGGKKLL